MYAARVAAAVAILLNLALLNVLLEAKGTKLGYACAKKLEATRSASLEQRRPEESMRSDRSATRSSKS